MVRTTGFAAITLVAVSAGAAHAEWTDGWNWAREWSRRVESLARSIAGPLTGGPPSDQEIIRPPGDIDPKMVVVPRPDQGRIRTIIPPETGRR